MFVQRWLYSTNAKDIAILYFIFAIFCGIAGTAMSVIIRMELTAPGSQYLHGNNQLFNVLVAGHAILMIFFMVMPALIGGFGKNKNKYNIWRNYSNLIIINNNYNKNKLGSYIAGLIEGNGTIHVPLTLKNKPIISIVFNINDKPLAIYLINLLNIGKIYDKKGNFIIWQINKIEDVYNLLDLTNKYYRTPKYYEILRLIKWYEEYINKNNNNILIKILNYYDIDESDLILNYWLAGFTDANGSFYIQLLKNKIKLRFSLEIKKIFNKDEQYYKNTLNNNIINLNLDYYKIIIKISNLFLTNLYSKNKELNKNSNIILSIAPGTDGTEGNIKICNKITKKSIIKIYSTYIIYVYNIKQYNNVLTYFNKYPLISSKYINYKDWEKLVILVLKYNTYSNPNIYKLAKEIKINFNKFRLLFNWKHLNNNNFN